MEYAQKGEVAKGRMQYVSAPAFEGFVYDITVVGV